MDESGTSVARSRKQGRPRITDAQDGQSVWDALTPERQHELTLLGVTPANFWAEGTALPSGWSDTLTDPERTVFFEVADRREARARTREWKRDNSPLPDELGKRRELGRRQSKRYYYRNRERILDRQRRAYAALSTPRRLWRSARKASRRAGLPFGLTVDYVASLWPDDGRCPVLGFRMVWDTEIGEAPSLDRIKPELGYVPGNVRIVSYRANALKSDAGREELMRVLAYVLAERPTSYDVRTVAMVIAFVESPGSEPRYYDIL